MAGTSLHRSCASATLTSGNLGSWCRCVHSASMTCSDRQSLHRASTALSSRSLTASQKGPWLPGASASRNLRL